MPVCRETQQTETRGFKNKYFACSGTYCLRVLFFYTKGYSRQLKDGVEM
jgi:hypothetical protein